MKRFFTLILALVTVASFTACEEFMGSLMNPGQQPEEGPDHDPTVKENWTVIGAVNHWDPLLEQPMEYNDGIYTAEITLYRGMSFCLRMDGAWVVYRGYAFDEDDIIDRNKGAMVSGDGTEFDVMHNGLDIYVDKGGKYLITWNAYTDKMKLELLEEYPDKWTIAGTFNNWNTEDVELEWNGEAMSRYYHIQVALNEGDEFLLYHHGAETTTYGKDFDSIVAGSYTMTTISTTPFVVPQTATYFFTFDMNASFPRIYTDSDYYMPTEDMWGVVGGFSGWENDTIMTYNAELDCFVAELEMYPTDDNGFKLRKNCSWTENRGGVLALHDEPNNQPLYYGQYISVYQNGPNLPLEEHAIYRLEYYYASETLVVTIVESFEQPEQPEQPMPDNKIPEDPNPDSTSFNHRILMVSHTAGGCPYCPGMRDKLKTMDETSLLSNNYTVVECHGSDFARTDRAYSEAAATLYAYYAVPGTPHISFNFHDGWVSNNGSSHYYIEEKLYSLVKPDGADAGIAIATNYYNNVVYVNTAVKAAVEQEYKVTVWLLENNIYTTGQAGATQEYHKIYNHALRNFGVSSQFPLSRTSTEEELSGTSIGVVEEGESTRWDFIIDVTSTKWVVENLEVLAIVSAKNSAGEWEVVNTATCPINSSISYDYL